MASLNNLKQEALGEMKDGMREMRKAM